MTLLAHKTPIADVVLIESTVHNDERGSFMRSFCAREFAHLGLPTGYPQENFSVNPLAGTLRGLHYQPTLQTGYKIVRCVAGKIWDVAVDMRRGSPTFGAWWGCELAGDGKYALFLPAGCAHGYITLEPGSALYYLMGSEYKKGEEQGIRFDDPGIGITWPVAPVLVSGADRSLPHLRDVVQ